MPKEQRRISISFPDTEICNELYDWIKEKGLVTNDSTFIRQKLYEKMVEEREQNKCK